MCLLIECIRKKETPRDIFLRKNRFLTILLLSTNSRIYEPPFPLTHNTPNLSPATLNHLFKVNQVHFWFADMFVIM